MATTRDESSPRGPWRGFLAGALLAALLSTLACAGIWALARALGVSLLVPNQQAGGALETLGLERVVVMCVAPALLAAALLWLLTRLTRRPVEVFLGLALALFVLMLFPLVALEMDVPTRVALGVMHTLAAMLIAGPLVGRVRPPPGAPG
jgi:hypothetical protein